MQSSRHISSLYTHSHGLTWQEYQAEEEAPHSGVSLQLQMDETPQDVVWPPTPHTVAECVNIF